MPRGEIPEQKTDAYISGVWYTIARNQMKYNSTGKQRTFENLAGQLTTTAWDSCFAYANNNRGELTNATAAVDAAYRYAYDFDDIGNRESAFERGTNYTYAANSLNQYTSISNFASSAFCAAEFIPQFDDDGNQTLIQTATGIWSVTYNGENRPILWTSGDNTIYMSFDRMGRRVAKNDQRFVYDGYLQIANFDLSATNSQLTTNNLQLFIWDPIEPVATRPLAWNYDTSSVFYTHDGNKNVSEVVAENGDVAAHYEYAPFGSLTVAACSAASTDYDFRFYNPFRFSSEYADDALGLVYYNYRHYNSNTAVWNLRDTLGEQASLNLYSFCSENPFVIDILGLKVVNKSKCPVVVKKESDKDGSEVVMPGVTYTGTQDGVYSCCNTNESCVVYKTVDGIDVTVTNDGFSTSGGKPLQKLGQACKGGCKDKEFLEENSNWPSLNKVKELCDAAKKKLEEEQKDRK